MIGEGDGNVMLPLKEEVLEVAAAAKQRWCLLPCSGGGLWQEACELQVSLDNKVKHLKTTTIKRVIEMNYLVKALATKPGHPSFISKTHMMEGKN